MRLPYSTELGYFNHVLTMVQTLSAGQESCDVVALVGMCKSLIFDGRHVDYSDIFSLASHANLINLKKGRAALTDLGYRFLQENPDFHFEFSSSQKELFASKVILNGPWKRISKRLLTNFIPNYSEVTFDFPISEVEDFGVELKAALHLLWVLDVLSRNETSYRVNPKYVKHVNTVRSSKKRISQRELEALIERNRESAKKAEEFVVDFEKTRLRTLGRFAEADRVIRISDLEVNAGFDVKSFDGIGPEVIYNRFIEVKSSKNSDVNFFWSTNEFETSLFLGENYWIYFVGNFEETNEKPDLHPVMFQNPRISVAQNPIFKMSVSEYRVRQIVKIG